MKLIYQNESLELLQDKTSCKIASCLPAVLVIEGEEISMTETAGADNQIQYEYEGIRVVDSFYPEPDGLVRIERKIVNNRERRCRIKSIFQVQTEFKPTHYLMPGVNYNGNEFGGNNVPTGLIRDGQPWVMAYDRSGIPSCTLSEDTEVGLALFASIKDEKSLRSSGSMYQNAEGKMIHRIFHPVSEMPYTYASKNTMAAPYEEYLTLVPGGEVTLEMFLFGCQPEWNNYACAKVLDRVLDVYAPDKRPDLSLQRVWDLGIAFSQALTKDCFGKKMQFTHYTYRLYKAQHDMSVTPEEMKYMMEEPYYTELGRFGKAFVIGWTGQGAMEARMFIIDGLAKENNDELQLGISQLDNWVATQQENGLLRPHYQNNFPDDDSPKVHPDACNMGWAMAEVAKSYRLLKEHGIDKPEYLRFSVKMCEFALKHFSPEYGFGKSWDMDGSVINKTGSIGGYIIMGLVETYREVQDARYLDLAAKAMDFYYNRDLNHFECTAGALDCCCVDKETAYPFLHSAVVLLELTGDDKYLTMAKKAGYYFTSWMFHFDCLYEEDSDFSKYGYYTTGGTLISAEHQALDPWGAAVVPEFVALYHYTKDERWLKRAQLMWCNGMLGVCTEEGMSYHGQIRPLGSQNEGFFHCRWTKYRPTCEERGHFNDYLDAWMGAFRMNTIASMTAADRKYFE